MTLRDRSNNVAALAALTALCTGLAACTTWGAPTIRRAEVTTPGELAPRETGLPGRASLRADGQLLFELDANRLCERRDRVSEKTTLVQRKVLSGGGILGLGLGAALIGLGISTLPSSVEVGTVPLLLGAAMTGTIAASRFRDTTRTQLSGERRLEPVVFQLPCPNTDPRAMIGGLRLTTSWGSVIDAELDAELRAVFPINWRRSPVDPLLDDARSQLVKPWTIAARNRGLAFRWQPGDTDVERALAALGGVAREPPALVVTAFEADGGRLTAGRRTVVRLTVENRGAGMAVELRGVTRSNLQALHGLELDFGNVAPRQSRTRTATVNIDEDEGEPSATVVVAFAEARGHTPPNYTTRFAITRAVCPDGKLSRAAYDNKRAALKRALDAGALTRAEFERYDAELVGCLR